MPLPNPANGLLVYCMNSGNTGFFVHQDNSWQKVGALSGYLSSEVDGSITNEIQTISRLGLTVTLENGGSFQDSVLSEAQVDNYVSNNGYLTSFTEVDGSTTNEIQNLTLSGDSLKIDKAGMGVDLAFFKDDLGNHTAIQNLNLGANKLVGNSGTNGISIASDGRVSLALGDSINEFSTDATLAGNSDLAVPTEKAVKTYVDNSPKVYAGIGVENYHFNLNNMQFLQSDSLGTAVRNIVLGSNSLYALTTGNFNIGLGYNTNLDLTIGPSNVAIGTQALKNNVSGSHNIAIGRDAGEFIAGSCNVLIGDETGENTTGKNNTLYRS